MNDRAVTRPRRPIAELVLYGCILLYVVVYSALSVARYDTFHTSTFDLGYFSQIVWNTAHGRWFETSISRATNVELIGNYLGEHVALVLLLAAPLYRLSAGCCAWAEPRLLLILQSIALGMAALPLYWITRRRTDDPRAALIVAGCYLAYPALGFVNLFDVHPIAFSILVIFLAAWALLEERTKLFWGLVVLALLIQEEMVIPLGVWGLVNFLCTASCAQHPMDGQRHRRRMGLGVLLLASLWAVVCFGLIIPSFNEGQPFRFWQLWSYLPGLAAQSSVQGGVAQPTAEASLGAVVLFLLHLALPLGFLPYLGPASLVVALPSLAYLLMGQRAALHSVGYQYPAVLIPWLFLAMAEGLQRLRRLANHSSGAWRVGYNAKAYRLGLACLLAGTLGTNILLNPIFLYARSGAFQPDPYQAQILEAMAQIPPEAGVTVVNRLGAHLAHRRVLVALEYPPPLRLDHVQMTDYVLLDLVDCRTVPASNQRARYAEIVTQVLQTGRFRVRYWSDRILLLERGTPSEKEMAAVSAYVAELVRQGRPCWP